MSALLVFYFFAAETGRASIVGSGGVVVGGNADVVTHVTPQAGGGRTVGPWRKYETPYEREWLARQQRRAVIVGSGGVGIGGSATVAVRRAVAPAVDMPAAVPMAPTPVHEAVTRPRAVPAFTLVRELVYVVDERRLADLRRRAQLAREDEELLLLEDVA